LLIRAQRIEEAYMQRTTELARIVDSPAIDRIAGPLSNAVRQTYESAGPAGRHAKNALHGVWLGHPLHPVFTVVHAPSGTSVNTG
jgi:hypothetical protein